MAKKKVYWIYSPGKGSTAKPSQIEKAAVQAYFQPLMEEFKEKCISKNPDKCFNYLIDIYTKWYQSNFYICEQYRAEYPDRMADEFETKLVRLKYTGKDRYDLSYLRHTGQWHPFASSLSLAECKEMILTNPFLQPNG